MIPPGTKCPNCERWMPHTRELGPNRMKMLRLIAEVDGTDTELTGGTVAQRLGIAKPNAYKLFERLRNYDFIRGARGRWKLTAKGRAVLGLEG